MIATTLPMFSKSDTFPESSQIPDEQTVFAAILEEVYRIRTCGTVRSNFHVLNAQETKLLQCHFTQESELRYVSAFLASEGFNPPDYWTFLTTEQATELLTSLVSSDMAYGGDICNKNEARALSRKFISLFDQRRLLLLSNGFRYQMIRGYALGSEAYTSLTEATFDSGLVAFDDSSIGYIWFEDED